MSETLVMVDTARQQAQRKANLKLALVLASVALVLGLGFVAKVVLFGR